MVNGSSEPWNPPESFHQCFLNKFLMVSTGFSGAAAGPAGAEVPVAPGAGEGPAKLGTPLPGRTFGLSIVPPSSIGTGILLTRLPRSPPTIPPTAPDPALAPGLTDTCP